MSFTSTSGRYKVEVPEGWARQETGSGVVFTDKFNTIAVGISTAATPPSVAIAQRAMAAIASSVACFKAGSVKQVTRIAGVVVLVTYEQSSPPDPVTGKTVTLDVEQYEYWRAGKQATVTLSSSHGSDNVDPWRRVTDSFAWS